MNEYLERLERVALLGVAELLWPRAAHPSLDDETRLRSASRLVHQGEARANRYYQVLLSVAAEAACDELRHTGVLPRARPR